MVQSRVLFLMERGLLFIKKEEASSIIFLLPYLGGNEQTGCEWYNADSREGCWEKGETVSEEERRKNSHQMLHTTLLLWKCKHLKEAGKEKKRWSGISFIKSCLHVAKPSTFFLSLALCLQRKPEGWLILKGLWTNVLETQAPNNYTH